MSQHAETIELPNAARPSSATALNSTPYYDQTRQTGLENENDLALADEPPQSKFVSHMASYPAVAATVGLVASFPVAKVFVSNFVPMMMALQSRNNSVVKRASPAIKRVDDLGDSMLNRVDKNFPRLKTAQPEDLYQMATEPARNVRTAANVYGNATRRTVKQKLLRPAKRVVRSARKQYARLHDTQGKALLRSQLDPIMLPLNNRLEGVIVDYIPGSGEMERPEVSNELSRNWRLARSAYRRARPAVRDQAAYMSDLPAAVRARVQNIYRDRRAAHPTGRRGATVAAMGTGRRLATDAVRLWRQPPTGLDNSSNGKSMIGENGDSGDSRDLYDDVNGAFDRNYPPQWVVDAEQST